MSTFNKGDKVVVVMDCYQPSTIKEFEVKSVSTDADWIQGTKPGEMYGCAFCFPIKYKSELTYICEELARRKKIADDGTS